MTSVGKFFTAMTVFWMVVVCAFVCVHFRGTYIGDWIAAGIMAPAIFGSMWLIKKVYPAAGL